MKHFFYYIFCLFLSFGFSQNSNIKALKTTYKVKYNTFEKQENRTENELKNQVLDLYIEVLKEAEKLISFDLIYHQSEAVFFRKQFLTPNYLEGYSSLMIQNFKSEFYYSNFETHTFYENTEFEGKYYQIGYTLDENQWKLTNETKKVGHYLCYKAIPKDDSQMFPVVWFAPELPNPIGPLRFSGFPGMVLEVQYKQYSLYCDAVQFSLDKKDIDNIKKPKGIQTSDKEFEKIIQKSRVNRY